MTKHQRLHFFGLGFERGQGKSGLVLTAARARHYLPLLGGFHIVDHGDLLLSHDSSPNRFFSEEQLAEFRWDLYSQAFHQGRAILENGERLLNWGGDHSVAIATVGAFIHQFDGFVLWIDAHADLNLPQASRTGYLHGMPLALLLNLGDAGRRQFPWFTKFLDPSRLIYLGLRDLDPFEKTTIAALGIRNYSYADIRERGIEVVADEILELTSGKPLHVSFDIDGMDPRFAPSTGVPVHGGLTPADLTVLRDSLFAFSTIPSVDVVEVNPGIGNPQDIDRTYLVAFHFLKMALQKPRGVYDRVGYGNDEASIESCASVSTENPLVDRIRSVSFENGRDSRRIDREL